MSSKTFFSYTFIILLGITILWYLSLPSISSRDNAIGHLQSKSLSTDNSTSNSPKTPLAPLLKTVNSAPFKLKPYTLPHELILEARDFSYPHIRSDNPNAVTIVGFFDFADSKCVSMYKVIDKIARSSRVNYIFRDVTLNNSCSRFAYIALQAYLGDFPQHLDFRARLVNLSPNYNQKVINQIAEDLKMSGLYLDSLVDKTEEDLLHMLGAKRADRVLSIPVFPLFRYETTIIPSINLAKRLNIGPNLLYPEEELYSLPALIIGDTFISGTLSEEEIIDIITKEENKKKFTAIPTKPLHPVKWEEEYTIDENSELTIQKYKTEIGEGFINDWYPRFGGLNNSEGVKVTGICDFSDIRCQLMLPEIKKITESDKVDYAFRNLLFEANNLEEALFNTKGALIDPSIIESLLYFNRSYLYFEVLPTLFSIIQKNPWLTYKDMWGILVEQELSDDLRLINLRDPSPNVKSTWELAQKIKVNSTPTFIIGNKFIVRGMISYENFMKLIHQADSSDNKISNIK